MADLNVGGETMVRGRYNATPQSLLDTATNELQLDANSNLLVNLNSITAALTTFIQGTADGSTLNAIVRKVNTESALITHDAAVRNILDELLLTVQQALEESGFSLDSSTPANGFNPGAGAYRVNSAATTNADVIATGPANINGYYLFNTSGTVKYVKLYNLNRAPTVGSDKPTVTIALPAGGGANLLDNLGAYFSQGIAIAITGAAADTDATAVAANDVIVNVFYSGVPDSTGFHVYRVISLATTNADVITSSECNLNGYYFFNTSGATKYVKLYNLNRAPVVGTDKPLDVFPIAAGGGANVMDSGGVLYSNGMAIAITGGAADTDTTAVVAGDVIANIFYS